MSQEYCPVHGALYIQNCPVRTQAELIPHRFQDPSHPVLHPFGGVPQTICSWHPQCFPGTPASSSVHELEGADEEEEEEEDTHSESDYFEVDSQYSSSSAATTASDHTITTTSTTSTFLDVDWAYDKSLNLTTLENLRQDFETELRNPSAWTLQRIIVLADTSEFGARESVRLWLDHVADLTHTRGEEPLRLPQITQHEDSPFYTPRTWEEANALPSEDRKSCFGRDVEEKHKQTARLLIKFLFPESESSGLSAGDKNIIFTVASNVWPLDPPKAKGLLWVMDQEYNTWDEENEHRWENHESKDFMIFTVLFPPPIVLTPPAASPYELIDSLSS